MSPKQTILREDLLCCECKGGRERAEGRAGEEGKVKGKAWDI